VIVLLDGVPQGDDWLRAEFDGHIGLVPSNYVDPITPFQIKAEALYDYKNNNEEELSFAAGDVIQVDSAQPYVSDWWTGTLNAKTGIFPSQYVKIAERFQIQAQVLYNYNAQEEDELNLEEGDYLLIEPNRFNDAGFVYAEKGVEYGYVADNYIRMLSSFLQPVEEKKKKEKLVYKEMLGVFEGLTMHGEQTKDFAERIARNTAESFPDAQLQTEAVWVASEEQHFLHKIEMEQARARFAPREASSSDWKAELPLISLTFEDEKVSEEELLRPEKLRRRTIFIKKTVTRRVPRVRHESSSDDGLIENLPSSNGFDLPRSASASGDLESGEDLPTVGSMGSIEPVRNNETSDGDDEHEPSSDDMEEFEEEIEEEIEVEEEPEEDFPPEPETPATERRRLGSSEDKKALATLDAIQLAYLRHMGTLFEALEYDRQTLEQHREQIVESIPKPPEVLKLSHLIPPIFSISRSLADEEDPDAVKLPPLVFSKNLKRLKAQPPAVTFEVGQKKEDPEAPEKQRRAVEACNSFSQLKANFFERCLTIFLVNQLVVFECIALGTTTRNTVLIEKLSLLSAPLKRAILPTPTGLLSDPQEKFGPDMRVVLGRFGSLFDRDGYDAIMKTAKTLTGRIMFRFSNQLPYLSTEGLQVLAKCLVAFMTNYVVSLTEEDRNTKLEEYKGPYVGLFFFPSFFFYWSDLFFYFFSSRRRGLRELWTFWWWEPCHSHLGSAHWRQISSSASS